MSAFNEIELSQDQTSVSIGAGQIWENVYQALQSAGLAVAGGRASGIGVGGLTLGGQSSEPLGIPLSHTPHTIVSGALKHCRIGGFVSPTPPHSQS